MILELYLPPFGGRDPSEVAAAYARYEAYLSSIRNRLPPSVLSIATAPWHHDPSFHQCPHDSWVQDLSVREVGSGARGERRRVEIEVVLLGAYHDGETRIHYEGVRGYSLNLAANGSTERGHGDWLIDEVRLSDTGAVLHEVVLSNSRWLIECVDMKWEWIENGET